jgi:hypothetical protein
MDEEWRDHELLSWHQHVWHAAFILGDVRTSWAHVVSHRLWARL